jgi:selenide,water dikinase
VYDLGDGQGLISTTDFFMPIVDDPHDFGRIAATNAISDVYAMGGTPLMAIAILGWPLEKLPPAVAGRVVEGGRRACADAGIALAGGHSIDNPEPIFGLAVSGRVPLSMLKKNSTAKAGDLLYLTKPLGVGILGTAGKKGLLTPEHARLHTDTMCQLNSVGPQVVGVEGVTAMTDVTGFGLLGHLLEMCEGSGVAATVSFAQVPILAPAADYAAKGAVPGATARNWDSYGHNVGPITEAQRLLLCDPQTSGGLLIAVRPEAKEQLLLVLSQAGLHLEVLGELKAYEGGPRVQVV